MPDSSTVATHVRFGAFTLDLRSGELRKGPTRLKVPDQSLEILKALVERPGQLVTREELQQRLWPANHYVDFEHGLNAAVRRLRDALGDSADTPKYIETLPRKGYRFISTIDVEAAQHSAVVSPVGLRAAQSRKWAFAWGSVALSIVLAVAASVLVIDRRRPPPVVSSPSSPTLTQITFDTGLQMNPSLSPDGQFVAYASNQSGDFDIWVRPVDASTRAVQVTTDGAHDWQPDWSPDGTQIVFRSERAGGGVYVVPALGGVERRIADFGYAPRWSPDGTMLLVSGLLLAGASRADVFTIDVRNAVRRPLNMSSLSEEEQRFSEIGWHPDGKRVTVFATPLVVGGKPVPHFVTIDINSGAAVRSAVDPKVQAAFFDQPVWEALTVESLVWNPDGRSIYFIGSSRGRHNVWTVDVDPHSLAITGGPRRLTAMSETNEGISISADGSRLVIGAANRNARVWLCTLASSGKRVVHGEAVSDEKLFTGAPDFTPDGRKLLFLTQRRGSGTSRTEAWERVLDSPTRDRLLFTNEGARGEVRSPPRWSPDGTQIAYRYVRPAPGSSPGDSTSITSLVVLDVATLKVRQLTTPIPASPGDEVAYGWTPDAQFIVASSRRFVPGQTAIALIPLAAAPAAEKAAQIVTQSAEYHLWNTVMSPNRKWICFQSEKDGTSQLAVVASRGGPWTSLTGKDVSSDKPRWSIDGRILYFISRSAGIFNVWGVEFDADKGTAMGEPFQVTQFDGLSGEIPATLDYVELGISEHRLAVPLIHPVGGIWMLENLRR